MLVRSVNTAIRPSFSTPLEKVAPGGEIKHGTVGEWFAEYQVDTFGKMLSIDRVKDVLLGDEGWTRGVDAFVRDAMARLGGDDTFDASAVEKELEALSRRIRAMVAMLADPSFDGLDELRTTLADLKQRRDALRAKLEERRPGRVLAYTEADLREWADGRSRQLEHIVPDRALFQETRDFVHAHVAAIEIDPHAKRGLLRVPADAMACLEHDISSRVAHEECRDAA